MERKVTEVEPVDSKEELAEYLILKMDIKNGFFMSEERMNRFKLLEDKFKDKVLMNKI